MEFLKKEIVNQASQRITDYIKRPNGRYHDHYFVDSEGNEIICKRAFASLYACEDTGAIQSIFFFKTKNKVLIPFDFGEGEDFWEPYLQWPSEWPNLTIFVNPVQIDDVLTQDNHPVGKMLKDHECWKPIEIAPKLYAFTVRSTFNHFEREHLIKWDYFTKSAVIKELFSRNQFDSSVLKAFGQGLLAANQLSPADKLLAMYS